MIGEWNPFEEAKAPPESVRIFGVERRDDDRARLCPTKQADIMDMALAGKSGMNLAIEQQLTEGVSVKDYGIRGFDLAYALLDPWDLVIIVDALSRGEVAGTLYAIEPELHGPASADTALNPHGMDPVRVLSLAASMGTISAQVLVVGCEPCDFGD